MRRVVVPALVLLLLAASCGGGKKETSLANLGASASPGAASAKPGSTGAAPAAKAGAKGGTTSAASKAGSSAKAGGPAPKTVAGGYTPPKDGDYVYRLDGEATNPFNPAAPPQKFSNQTLTKKVSHSGNVITTDQTSSTSSGKTTQRVRWEPTRLLLLYVNAETPQGDFSCTFNPPLLLAHFPVHPETIPTQPFKGQGSACNGKLDITIERREPAKDTTGKSWDAWRVHVRTETTAGQFTQDSDDRRWVSPALGEEIRTQGTFTYKISGAGGSQTGHGSQTSVLKSYPK